MEMVNKITYSERILAAHSLRKSGFIELALKEEDALKRIFTEVELSYLPTDLNELYPMIPVQRGTPVHKYARSEGMQLTVIGEHTHDDIIRCIVLPKALHGKGMMYQEATNSIYANITSTLCHVSIFPLCNGTFK